VLKKTITFNDLDGNPVTEDFYFNLNKAEIAEMELSYDGGLSDYLQKIIATNDGGAIISAFKDIVTKSVGRRSEDGRRFMKSPDITNEFLQTEAYSEMFMSLVTDATAASEFIKGIVPQEMSQKIENVELPAEDDRPAWIREDREPTKQEMLVMSQEQLREAYTRKLERGV
jgi:hypothetical protein